MGGWRALAAQFLRFGVVGATGVVVDSAVLLLALRLGFGPYGGRVLSYLVAATANWALNRAWTFRGNGAAMGRAQQWGRFLIVNLAGFVANYGTYALLLNTVPAVRDQPVIGVAAGALVGMTGNFALSRRYVFRPG
ncbi:GtrA family protein [Roseomonas elaeocarpi]|uniref:GtrA family protein n=1 Tax=Roseomonas elaeocarpi TaxID=907779 RepID=A0ABV6JWG8_9PROT